MLKFEPLTKLHDRSGFDCGSEPLNRFLRETARQHTERGISKTFVFVDENSPPPRPILGFFTLSLCEESAKVLPETLAKNFPDHNVGGIRLCRLAVSKSSQRQGIGKALVIAALTHFSKVFTLVGGIGLFVDAKNHKAKHFYEHFGFVALPPDGQQLLIPLQTIQKILKPLETLP